MITQFPYTNFHDINLDWIISRLAKSNSIENTPFYYVLEDGVFNDIINEANSEKKNIILLAPGVELACDNSIDLSHITIYGTDTSKIVISSNATIRCKDKTIIANLQIVATNTTTEALQMFDNSELHSVSISHEHIGVATLGQGCVIDNCSFDGNSTGNFAIWSEQAPDYSSLVIENTIFENHKLNAVYGKFNKIVIHNCVFVNNHLQYNPTGGGQIDILSMPDTYTEISDNVIISDTANATAGIEVNDCCPCYIYNNKIVNQLTAIALQAGGAGYHISDNTIIDCTNLITVESAISYYEFNNNYANSGVIQLSEITNQFAEIRNNKIESGVVKQPAGSCQPNYRFSENISEYMDIVTTYIGLDADDYIELTDAIAGTITVWDMTNKNKFAIMYDPDTISLFVMWHASTAPTIGSDTGSYIAVFLDNGNVRIKNKDSNTVYLKINISDQV